MLSLLTIQRHKKHAEGLWCTLLYGLKALLVFVLALEGGKHADISNGYGNCKVLGLHFCLQWLLYLGLWTQKWHAILASFKSTCYIISYSQFRVLDKILEVLWSGRKYPTINVYFCSSIKYYTHMKFVSKGLSFY